VSVVQCTVLHRYMTNFKLSHKEKLLLSTLSSVYGAQLMQSKCHWLWCILCVSYVDRNENTRTIKRGGMDQ
jgi:hypothetical protein